MSLVLPVSRINSDRHVDPDPGQVSDLGYRRTQRLIFAPSVPREPPPPPRAFFGRDELIEKVVSFAERLVVESARLPPLSPSSTTIESYGGSVKTAGSSVAISSLHRALTFSVNSPCSLAQASKTPRIWPPCNDTCRQRRC